MAITTVFDPADYIVTSKMILGEFIQSALPEVKVVPSFPFYLARDGATLSQPLVWIRAMPSRNKQVGSGKSIGSGKGVWKLMHFQVYIIAENSNDQGKYMVDQLSGKLEQFFLQNSHQLGQAKLKNAEITPPADVLEWQGSNFVGAVHNVFCKVLLAA